MSYIFGEILTIACQQVIRYCQLPFRYINSHLCTALFFAVLNCTVMLLSRYPTRLLSTPNRNLGRVTKPEIGRTLGRRQLEKN